MADGFFLKKKKCSICELTNDQHSFIICDRCNDEFHVDCLEENSIALDQEWICPFCSAQEQQQELEGEKFDEVENFTIQLMDSLTSEQQFDSSLF